MTDSTEISMDNDSDATHRPNRMFVINPDIDNRTLLEHARQSMASAYDIAGSFINHPSESQTKALMGIQRLIMTAELAVNRALDILDSPRTT